GPFSALAQAWRRWSTGREESGSRTRSTSSWSSTTSSVTPASTSTRRGGSSPPGERGVQRGAFARPQGGVDALAFEDLVERLAGLWDRVLGEEPGDVSNH